MTEVIAYLIEHFQDFDNCPPPEDLGRLLEDAGFDVTEIGNTLMMMEVLSTRPNSLPRRSTAMPCACIATKKWKTCRRKSWG